MARIEPFRGWRYRVSQPSDLTKLVTPPYDVIPADRRRALAAAHPHNFVHLILPQAEGTLDAYAHAARLLEEWRRDGVLIKDEVPSLTLHRQSYVLEDGRRLNSTGRAIAWRFKNSGTAGHARSLSRICRLRIERHRKATRMASFTATGSNGEQECTQTTTRGFDV